MITIGPPSDRHPRSLGLNLLEQRPSHVLVGRSRPPGGATREPARIVVAQPAFVRRRVELADLVARLGPVLENLVAVREALRDVERATSCRPSARPTTCSRYVGLSGRRSTMMSRIAPRVAADELRLGGGRVLEVHAAERAADARLNATFA